MHGKTAARSRASQSGFTMVELILVLVLLAIIFSFAAPRLSGLSPKYRLRSYGRRVAATIEKTRVAAIVSGKTMGIRYVIDDVEGHACMIVPPAPPDYPEQPVEEREAFTPDPVPTGVRIRSIVIPGSGAFTNGTVTIAFSAAGTTGSHIVILEVQVPGNEVPNVLALKYNSISGILDYYNEEVEFQHYEG